MITNHFSLFFSNFAPKISNTLNYMKQPFFLFYFLLCWNINLLAQEKNIDGSYYDEVGFEIKITDNHFYYIEEQKHMRLWYTDTLAICTYEWVDKNFIKINSKSPTEILLPEMKITQSFDSTLHDSITVVFQMPYNGNRLITEVTDDRYKSYKSEYRKGNSSIKLPKNTKKFNFLIYPQEAYWHTVDGRFFGITYYNPPFIDFEIKEDTNLITINIPALDNSFFERYYVVDEFVQVKNNHIYWKGKDFKKR